MLPLDSILLDYPSYLREKRSHILKEFLQYKILNIIYTSEYARKLYFLGGTALRIMHQNNRFSEDLDFDNLGLTAEEWIDLSSIIKKSLTLEGLEVEIRNIFKGAYHCHIKIPELLYRENLSPLKAQKILIQLDTVPQNFEYVPDQNILKRWNMTIPVFSTPKDLLLSQKIYASLERKRTKGRDFFDIIFLLGIGATPNFEYLDKHLGISTPVQAKQYLLDNTQNLDFLRLGREVQPFLFNPNDVSKVEQFREFIETHWG